MKMLQKLNMRALDLACVWSGEGSSPEDVVERAQIYADYAGEDEAKWYALTKAVYVTGSVEKILANAELFLSFVEGRPPSHREQRRIA